MYQDTIAALATPPGEGGIGILRISGPDAIEIAGRILIKKNGKKHELKERYFHYGYIAEENGNVVDEVFVVPMHAPRTYTGEDVVEIHCHGGMVPINRILKLVLRCGARLAEPGEFTKRAFLNGRIDLAQAEGVMDFIAAKTEEAANASFKQMQGTLSTHIRRARTELMGIMAHLEAVVDYPEDDIEEVFIDDLKKQLAEIREECRKLLETADQGRLIREGIRTVIAGKPNVGKSSLLNALLKENRAIVTDIPGTTRDVIEEYLNIRGIMVRIMDTAGIRETNDIVEQIGVKKTREEIENADLVLLIFDASMPVDEEDREIMAQIKNKRVLVLLNKSDKPAATTEADIKHLNRDAEVIQTSMVDGTGIEEIKDFLHSLVYSGRISRSHGLIITNGRHKEALIRADQFLSDAINAVENGVPIDMAAIDIRSALEALGEITGENLAEDLIDRIFSEFCLGK